MNVLITGGAGFIGSAAVRALLAEGHEVAVFDNLETGSVENLPPGVPLLRGDIRDRAALAAALAGRDAVVHLAALVSVPVSVADPAACWEINVVGTQNVLDEAQKAGCRRFVQASSSAVYGEAHTLPAHEDLAVDPKSPYAYSKWMNETQAAYYARFAGMESASLRFFNVYGPRQRADSPYSGVISIATRCFVEQSPFTIFGNGEQTRDFVYVDDVASAILAACTRPLDGPEVLNVGTGKHITLRELLSILGTLLGRHTAIAYAPERAGDLRHSQANVFRLKERLGVQASTPLDVGLARTLEWAASHVQCPI